MPKDRYGYKISMLDLMNPLKDSAKKVMSYYPTGNVDVSWEGIKNVFRNTKESALNTHTSDPWGRKKLCNVVSLWRW